MKIRNWSNFLLATTCFLCIFTAFLTFSMAIIYLSFFVISSQKEQEGCSRQEQIRGIECAPKIEELSLALEQLDPSNMYEDFERIREISLFCNITLSCVSPIKCKSISQEYEFVKKSCAVFDFLAEKFA